MKNLAISDAVEDSHHVKVKRAWEKPLLDILKLESAERGPLPHIPDQAMQHRSGN